MKTKLFIAFILLVGTCFAQEKTTTTVVKNDNVVVLISDNKTCYEFSSEFDADKTSKVMAYMDDHLKGSGISFKNTQADADLTLNNKMTFHMKSSPGKLAFKFDKRKNSAEFYQQFKEMCEGIKDLIQKK